MYISNYCWGAVSCSEWVLAVYAVMLFLGRFVAGLCAGAECVLLWEEGALLVAFFPCLYASGRINKGVYSSEQSSFAGVWFLIDFMVLSIILHWGLYWTKLINLCLLHQAVFISSSLGVAALASISNDLSLKIVVTKGFLIRLLIPSRLPFSFN